MLLKWQRKNFEAGVGPGFPGNPDLPDEGQGTGFLLGKVKKEGTQAEERFGAGWPGRRMAEGCKRGPAARPVRELLLSRDLLCHEVRF